MRKVIGEDPFMSGAHLVAVGLQFDATEEIGDRHPLTRWPGGAGERPTRLAPAGRIEEIGGLPCHEMTG